MYDELRLVAIGFPLEDAVSICYSMRKEGDLEDFIHQQEELYRNRCARYVKEVID